MSCVVSQTIIIKSCTIGNGRIIHSFHNMGLSGKLVGNPGPGGGLKTGRVATGQAFQRTSSLFVDRSQNCLPLISAGLVTRLASGGPIPDSRDPLLQHLPPSLVTTPPTSIGGSLLAAGGAQLNKR